MSRHPLSALTLLAAAVVVAGCRFAERSESGEEAAASAVFRESGLRQETGEGELRSAEAFLGSLQTLRARGAVEEVRALLDPGAALVDGATVHGGGAPESELRDLLAPGAGFGTWSLLEEGRAEGGRLFLLEYRREGSPEARVVESLLLVPGREGWRIRLLHRSALP